MNSNDERFLRAANREYKALVDADAALDACVEALEEILQDHVNWHDIHAIPNCICSEWIKPRAALEQAKKVRAT